MGKEKFIVSVVIPVYNSEEFVGEAIESVINQTMGIDRIQIVLIDDGSTDDSAGICRQYCERYPGNIEYHYKENGGVSSARNLGLEYVQGRYVSFLDSDDKWSKNAFSDATAFFDRHYDKVDMVSCRITIFNKTKEWAHPLNYKYDEENKIVNLLEEYKYIQLNIGNALYKTDAIAGRQFETDMEILEDAFFVASLLMEKHAVGIETQGEYFYRKHEKANSLSGANNLNRFWYMEVPKLYDLRLIEISRKKYGYVLPYIQYSIMYDLRWRKSNTGIDETLTEEEKTIYGELIQTIIKNIDDEIITSLEDVSRIYKLLYLDLKYGRNILNEVSMNENGRLMFNDCVIFNVKGWGRCHVVVLEVENDHMILKGTTDIMALNGALELFAEDEEESSYKVDVAPYEGLSRYAFTGEKIQQGMSFEIKIPIHVGTRIRFYVRYRNGETKYYTKVSFGKFAPLYSWKKRQIESKYYVSGKYLLKFNQRKGISVYKNRVRTHIASEIRYINEIRKIKDMDLKSIIPARIRYYLSKPFFRKPVWIISDRRYKAGDNGESFFRHAMISEIRRTHRIYFAFSKEEKKEYRRLKKTGRVLDPSSVHYRTVFLHADKIISAHAEDVITNPFMEKRAYINDLYHHEFVYLQHGVMPGDMSRWLNCLNKNIKLITMTTERERNSVLNYDYGYTKDNVRLTGAPRYDELYEGSEKLIVFIPTWRKNLTGVHTKDMRDYEYNPDFVESEYYKFYNGLINDERIIKAIKENGYTGEFYAHPSLRRQACDFTGNEAVMVSQETADYNRIISESRLAVTDYSSAIFDFAYLGKSIIYSQFDKDTYWQDHTYDEGYFHYERDGFGPVYFDYESTVKGIVAAIEADCRNPEKYVKRAESFFAFHDHENSKRAIRAVLDMEKK